MLKTRIVCQSHINKYKKDIKSFPSSMHIWVGKLLLVLKVFYKVKIKSDCHFFFCVTLASVCAKCFFSTMSPHKLQPILHPYILCHLLGLIPGLLLFLPRTRCTSALCQHFHTSKRYSFTCSTGSFDFVPEGHQFAHLEMCQVHV